MKLEKEIRTERGRYNEAGTTYRNRAEKGIS